MRRWVCVGRYEEETIHVSAYKGEPPTCWFKNSAREPAHMEDCGWAIVTIEPWTEEMEDA